MTSPTIPTNPDDLADYLTRLSAGNNHLVNNPSIVNGLASAGATPQQAGAINIFVGATLADAQQRLADANNVSIRLAADQQQAQAAVLAQRQQQQQQPDTGWHWGSLGQIGHSLGRVVHDVTHNPVTDAIGEAGHFVDTGVSNFGESMWDNLSDIGTFHHDAKYGWGSDKWISALKSRDEAMAAAGYDANSPVSSAAYAASGQSVLDLSDLYNQHGADQVNQALQFANMGPDRYFQQFVKDHPGLTQDEADAMAARLNSPDFHALVDQIKGRRATIGNLLTEGIDPTAHPREKALLSGAIDFAAALWTDPTNLAFAGMKVYKASQLVMDSMGDTERVYSILNGTKKGYYAAQVRNGFNLLIEQSKVIREGLAEGDSAKVAAAYARIRGAAPGLVHLVDDFNGGLRAVGYGRDGLIFGKGAPIENMEDAAEYLSSQVGVVRLFSGRPAAESGMIPGALSAFGYHKLRGALAAGIARRGVSHNADIDFRDVNTARRFGATDGDAVDVATGAGDTGLIDAAAEEAGGLASAARGMTARGKGYFASRKGLGPFAVGNRFRLAAQRWISLLPKSYDFATNDPNATENIFRYTNMYGTRSDAYLLAAKYATASEAERKSILIGLHLQTLHAAGFGTTEAGRGILDRASTSLKGERYGVTDEGFDDPATGERRFAALWPSQTNPSIRLTNFGDLQRYGAKLGYWSNTVGRMLNSNVVDEFMKLLRTGWQFTYASVLRNSGEDVVHAWTRGQFGAMVRAKMAGGEAGVLPGRLVPDLLKRTKYGSTIMAPFARIARLYHRAGISTADPSLGLDYIQDLEPDEIAQIADNFMSMRVKSLIDPEGVDDATEIIGQGLTPGRTQWTRTGFGEYDAEGEIGAERLANHLGLVANGNIDLVRALLDHIGNAGHDTISEDAFGAVPHSLFAAGVDSGADLPAAQREFNKVPAAFDHKELGDLVFAKAAEKRRADSEAAAAEMEDGDTSPMALWRYASTALDRPQAERYLDGLGLTADQWRNVAREVGLKLPGVADVSTDFDPNLVREFLLRRVDGNAKVLGMLAEGRGEDDFRRAVEELGGYGALSLGDPLKDALMNWVHGHVDGGAEPTINTALRGRAPMTDELRGQIAALDAKFAESRLSEPIVTYRGYSDARGIMPDDWETRDLTGFSWGNKGYAPVSTLAPHAEGFAGAPGVGMAVRIHLPAGHPALSLTDTTPGAPAHEYEVLLPRDTTFRVVKDWGVLPAGNFHGETRWLDVVPDSVRVEPSTAGATFPDRLSAAATGQEALDAVPATLHRAPGGHHGDYTGEGLTAPAGAGSVRALSGYEGVEFDRINGFLRDRDSFTRTYPHDTPEMRDAHDRLVREATHNVAEIDKTMAVSRLQRPVRVDRVVRDGAAIFGKDAWFGPDYAAIPRGDFDAEDKFFDEWKAGEHRPNLTGQTWTDKAYQSTSADPAAAAEHGKRWPGLFRDGLDTSEPVIFTMHVPQGIGAVQLSEMGHAAEVLLDRGLTMKVVADHGIGPDGFRHLDIDVAPRAGYDASAVMVHHGPDINRVVDALKADPRFDRMSQGIVFRDADGVDRKAITDGEKELAYRQLAEKQVTELRYLMSGRDGDSLNEPLMQYLREVGKAPDTQWIMDNLDVMGRPKTVLAPSYEALPADPSKAGLVSGLARAYKYLVDRPIARISSMPIFLAHYGQARAFMAPWEDKLVEGGLDREAADHLAKNISMQMAMNRTLKYIDDPTTRTAMDTVARGFFAYSRATTAFIRRWSTSMIENPQRLRKLMLAYEAAHKTGLIYTDANGQENFTYPGSGFAIDAMQRLANLLPGVNVFGVPGLTPDLSSKVNFLSPGLGNPLQMSATPMVNIPMRFIFNAFPEHRQALDEVDSLINGSQGQGASLLQEVEPTAFKKLADALNDDDRNSLTADAMRSAILNLAAAGQMPDSSADSAQMQKFLASLRAQTHNQLLLRAVFGYFAPATPGIPSESTSDSHAGWYYGANGVQSLSDEYKQILNDAGGDVGKAGQLWAALHPDKLMYTVSSSEATQKSGGLAATQASQNWVNQHLGFMQNYSGVAAYLVPPATQDGQFDLGAYNAQFELGLRQHKTTEDFANQVATAGASHMYFQSIKARDAAIQANPDQEAAIRQQFGIWKDQFYALNPLFANVATNSPDATKTANDQLIQLRQLVQDPNVPADVPVAQVQQMIQAYDEYHRVLATYTGNSQQASAIHSDVAGQYNEWMLRMIAAHPALAGLYTGIFRTLDPQTLDPLGSTS